MRKNVKSVILVLMLACAVIALSACVAEEHAVIYKAGEGGRILGVATQMVENGEDGIEVVAQPNGGYEFAGWSDGKTNPIRTDTNITEGFSVTASFRIITKTFTYVYNKATDCNTETNTTLFYDTLYDTSFIVPVREYFNFNGWYLEENFITQVADENGALQIDKEIFNAESECLYAKWTVIEETTFKILLVFVTEIKATLYTEAPESIRVDVDYKLSETEKKVCELIPVVMEQSLNKIFGGLVKFEIDTYFTNEIITEESFTYQYSGTKRDYRIYAEDIPELWPMLKNYRSIITSYYANDEEALLYASVGVGTAKYASVHLDAEFKSKQPLENLLDLTSKHWDTILSTYLHEFAHTAESESNAYEFHKVLYKDGSILVSKAIIITGEYLLNQSIIDGERVGIPYSYWKGDFDVLIYYSAHSGGYIKGGKSYEVYIPYGGDAEEITAVPAPGYRFVTWSDGVTTATRQETSVISRLNIHAIFERDGSPIEPQIFSFALNSSDFTCSVKLIDKTLTTIHVPAAIDIGGYEYTVIEIASSGFASTQNLKYAYLPATIKIIGTSAFANCKNLEIISMPAVEHIGTNAFAFCSSLTDIIIPNTVITMGSTIFRNNSTKVHVRPGADTSDWASDWNDRNSITEVDYDSDFELPVTTE